MDANRRNLNNNLDIKIGMGSLSFNLLSINYEPPRFPWHTGNHCHSSYELHFIPAGQGTLIVDDTRYDITPGTFYLTGPEVYHEQSSDKADPMVEYCLNFDFNASDKPGRAAARYCTEESEAVRQALTETSFWFGRDSFDGAGLCQKLIQETETRCIGYYHVIQTLTLQVILLSARTFSDNRKADYALPQKSLNTRRRILLDEFFRSYAEPRKVEELAVGLGVSIRQLDRILIQHYGLSFKQKLIRTRIDQAKALLVNTEDSVASIAVAVGYNSVACFCKLFREQTQCTPSEYRAHMAKEQSESAAIR